MKIFDIWEVPKRPESVLPNENKLEITRGRGGGIQYITITSLMKTNFKLRHSVGAIMLWCFLQTVFDCWWPPTFS